MKACQVEKGRDRGGVGRVGVGWVGLGVGYGRVEVR